MLSEINRAQRDQYCVIPLESSQTDGNGERDAGLWGPGEMGWESSFSGTASLFCKMSKFWSPGSQQCEYA